MKARPWLCLVLGVCVTIAGGQAAAAAPAAGIEESYRQIFTPMEPALEISSNFSPATLEVPTHEYCCNPPVFPPWGCCIGFPANSCAAAGGTAWPRAAICLVNCNFLGC